MKENSGETLGKIVNLRALAIIIVVIGHSIILYSHKWGLYSTIYNVRFLDILKDWINLIQMPLFLSISGFLFARSYKKYKFKAFVMKKAKRLLIPYVFCRCILDVSYKESGWILLTEYNTVYS